jgi:hypothetical protein
MFLDRINRIFRISEKNPVNPAILSKTMATLNFEFALGQTPRAVMG